MTTFVYLIAEGVTDVTLITRVLVRYCRMVEIGKKSELPDKAKTWLDGIKWPVGEDIGRLAVPAPVFVQRESILIAIRNAQGLGGMRRWLDADNQTFFRIDWAPDALGILLDADNKQPSQRFSSARAQLDGFESFPSLNDLRDIGKVADSEDGRRSGIFVFPDNEAQGTVESLLLTLGAAGFPELSDSSREFVERWDAPKGQERLFKELRKPAGLSKARLSAMASLLKPGKNLNASLKDHPWVPEREPPEVLKPLVRFLERLIQTAPDS